MAGGALSENDRHCLETGVKRPSEYLQESEKQSECKSNGLRVRFLDEEGKTERTVSADETDAVVSRVKKIHILKNRSSSETSILLRNPSLMKRRSSAERRLSDGQTGNLNNNSLSENFNGLAKAMNKEIEKTDKTEQKGDPTKDIIGQSFKKNSNVYSVNQAKTLTPEKKKSLPMIMPKLKSNKLHDSTPEKSTLPAEGSLAESHAAKDFTSRTIGRISKGIGRLLRRTNSVRISEPDPTYKVAYLGNVLTGWARGESCIEKPLATLWRNYQQSSKPDVVMKLSVSNSGLKGATKEHGLTEYWSHRITYCASPPHYPKLFCWVYRHEGKKLKHELRCHAVLCAKETVSKKITEELQIKVKQALLEFKKDRISKQNARLSLANSVYDNPSMPRRKILLSVGAMNYRPPLERSKSAPKLGAIEELCSEEDEEEAEMNAKQNICNAWARNSLSEDSAASYCSSPVFQRLKSPRKLSCPSVMHRSRSHSDSGPVTDQLIDPLVQESQKNMHDNYSYNETSQDEAKKQEARTHTLESISESSELADNPTCIGQTRNLQLLSQSNFLVTDSDDGSVSSGCETASTVNSDAEPSSLPSHYVHDEIKETLEIVQKIAVSDRIQNFACVDSVGSCSSATDSQNEVNLVPIGEKSSFRRRSTYPPLRMDAVFNEFEGKFESLIVNSTDMDSLNSSSEADVFKNSGDNDSACSDESGYSELLENGKDSIIGESCIEKPLATLWRNYQQSSKPDVVMKLSVSNSGLKGATKEHGLTEYWSHRITYCASPPHYPKLFCWVYRHEGKKLKHELRCHAVLCAKETVSKKITEELQIKVKQALLEFKKDRISKQNARLSLANSVYDNPSMPRRKILLSVGAMNYRPPLERSKSAPKLGAIEELCSEEDEEEAEMNAKQNICNAWARNSLSEDSAASYCSSPVFQRLKSPRKLSCPSVMHRSRSHSDSGPVTDQLIDPLVQESQKNMHDNYSYNETSQDEAKKQEARTHTLESISESSELADNPTCIGQTRNLQLLSQSNFLVTDSDDGSVSSGCETASTVNSDAEPSSLPSHYVHDEIKETLEIVQKIAVSDRIQNFACVDSVGSCSSATDSQNEVNLVPIGEKSSFRRRSTYPPLRMDAVFNEFEGKFESLIVNSTDMDSLNSSSEADVFKNSGDNDSACSDESGYSELLENGKDSIIGNTIMV